LVDDRWVHDAAPQSKPTKVSPLGTKFLSALHGALASGPTQTFQTWKAITFDQWRSECFTVGLLDPDKAPSARTLFNRYKNELIAANEIACHDKLVWLQ
jgi:hypothetical protein